MTISYGEETMKDSRIKSSPLFRWANVAELLNWRVIRTPYFKGTLYFIMALAVCLLFYLFITHMPLTS